MKRLLALAAVLAGCLVAAVFGAAPAVAHPTLASSDPADGARLATAPARVTVTFTEDVSVGVGYLTVIDGRGRRVDEGVPAHPGGDGRVVSVRLRSGLPAGSFIVRYRVVAADSHPIAGAVAFVVGGGPVVAATG